MAAGDRCGV